MTQHHHCGQPSESTRAKATMDPNAHQSWQSLRMSSEERIAMMQRMANEQGGIAGSSAGMNPRLANAFLAANNNNNTANTGMNSNFLQQMNPNQLHPGIAQYQMNMNVSPHEMDVRVQQLQEQMQHHPSPSLLHQPQPQIQHLQARQMQIQIMQQQQQQQAVKVQEVHHASPVPSAPSSSLKRSSSASASPAAASSSSAAPVASSSSSTNQSSNAASMDAASLLHNSCKLYPDTLMVVESALQMDPQAIRRRIPTVCSATEKNSKQQRCRKRAATERFAFPINIALKCNASAEIIQLLAQAGPDVLAEQDGPDKASSLATALALEYDKGIIQLLLKTNPACAETLDRHSNTPLHSLLRCQRIPLDIVKLVYYAYPKALTTHNFHTQTPLDIAIRSSFCPEEVVNFLQSKTFSSLEEHATHMDDF